MKNKEIDDKRLRELWRQGKAKRRIKCLRCETYFISESASIRTCKRCKDNNKNDYSPVYHFYG